MSPRTIWLVETEESGEWVIDWTIPMHRTGPAAFLRASHEREAYPQSRFRVVAYVPRRVSPRKVKK